MIFDYLISLKNQRQINQKECQNIAKASDIAKTMIQENKALNISIFLENTVCLYNSFNKYSVVAYDGKCYTEMLN